MVWTLAAPVGGLGSLFHSNWVDSSSLIVKNHWGDLFSLSLSHSFTLAVSHSVPSVSQLLLFLRSHVFTGFLFDFFLFNIFFSIFFFFPSCLRPPSPSPLVQSDLSVGEWQQDSNSGNTSRVLSYTIALNNPLGPKTAPVVETQVSLR